MKEKLFLWSSEQGAWYFLPITKKVGVELKERYGKYAKGFRSLPVEVTIGETTWQTSIFPDKSSGSYILPVKAAVRKAEDMCSGDQVSFALRVR